MLPRENGSGESPNSAPSEEEHPILIFSGVGEHASPEPPPDYDVFHQRVLAEDWDRVCQPTTLVGLLKNPAVTSNPEALIEVANVIAIVSQNPNFGARLRSALGQAGVVVPLTRLFIENSPSATSRVLVIGHILNAVVSLCANHPQNQAAFGREGIVAPLTALLGTIPDINTLPGELVEPVLVAISHLSSDPDNRAAFGEPAVIDSLVRIVASAADPARATDPVVARALLSAVSQLALDPHNRASFGRTAMIPQLVRLLVSNQALATHPIVAEAFFSAIDHLAYRSPQNQTVFRQAGIVPVLADLLVAGRLGPATRSLLGAIVKLTDACPENGAAFLGTRLLDRLRAAPQVRPGPGGPPPPPDPRPARPPIFQPLAPAQLADELEQLFRGQ
ncbi:hypothetical protein PAPYR_10153 [Paratrimastix pyriformis]|uniref:Uncharacterized protein n=1 Tax=Paratrimastix pyriformis TaxID=342808 RepID=A0ABQ8U6K5_9EUKA|nr:hypothetical protein PAPYR_10153 [Paratrimastix pyriformis]